MSSEPQSTDNPMPTEPTSFAAPTLPRLFVGLELPPTISSSISSLLDPAQVSAARWLPASSWHITLHFLGATPLDDVRNALAAVRSEPFTASVRDAGTFARRGRPHVLWAGVPTTPGLTALHGALGHALSGAGFRVDERPFRPHVTLARLKCRKKEDAEGVNSIVREISQFESPAFQVTSFTLFESVISEGGGTLYLSRGQYSLSEGKDSS